jgi:hypothetical protein
MRTCLQRRGGGTASNGNGAEQGGAPALAPANTGCLLKRPNKARAVRLQSIERQVQGPPILSIGAADGGGASGTRRHDCMPSLRRICQRLRKYSKITLIGYLYRTPTSPQQPVSELARRTVIANLAQLGERETEVLEVGGSIPPVGN